MINGIIKLFYNDKVKSSIKSKAYKRYLINDKIIILKNINKTMDEFIKDITGITFISSILFISFNLNLLVGFIIISLMITNIIYKKYYKIDLNYEYIAKISNIKNVLKKEDREDFKKSLVAMSSLILIGIASDFNYIIGICIVIILLFTTKKIYSNINR